MENRRNTGLEPDRSPDMLLVDGVLGLIRSTWNSSSLLRLIRISILERIMSSQVDMSFLSSNITVRSCVTSFTSAERNDNRVQVEREDPVLLSQDASLRACISSIQNDPSTISLVETIVPRETQYEASGIRSAGPVDSYWNIVPSSRRLKHFGTAFATNSRRLCAGEGRSGRIVPTPSQWPAWTSLPVLEEEGTSSTGVLEGGASAACEEGTFTKEWRLD